MQAIRDMVTQSAGPYTAAAMGMALAAYECREKSADEQLAYLQARRNNPQTRAHNLQAEEAGLRRHVWRRQSWRFVRGVRLILLSANML